MAELDTKIHHGATPTNRELVQENAQLKAENQWLKEQLGLVKQRLFAPTSEKSPTGQEALLFNEAEATSAPDVPEPVTTAPPVSLVTTEATSVKTAATSIF